MDIIRKQDFIELINHNDGDHVSIFMQAHPVGREMQQDPVRLRNLITQAREKLMEGGMRQPDAIELLQPASDLLDDNDFWQHQSEGLALFLAKDHFRYFRLPVKLEELVVVAPHYHTKPILPMLAGDGQFYILAISLNKLRLFNATRSLIQEIDPDEMPESLAEVLRFDDPEYTLQFHTGTASPHKPGDRRAMFFGQGVGTDDEKENIKRYFHKVDKGLEETLVNENQPLALIGVDYILSLFREVSDYPHLVEEQVTGNPDQMKMKEIHDKVWAVVSPIFEKDQQEARSKFMDLQGPDKNLATTDISEAVSAAHYGKVETLFVPFGKQVWGYFDPMKDRVFLQKEETSENFDLLDYAAAQTLDKGGTVYVLSEDNMPKDAEVAAVFRYET